MLPTSAQELYEAFAGAKNLNAALKNLLKREGTNTPHVVTFAKDFRAAAVQGKSVALQLFIERNYPAKESFFMGAARYAFPEFIESVVSKIVEKHADDFNATYTRGDEGISVTDAKTFKRIVAEVQAIIDAELQAAELPTNNFLRNSVMTAVFEVDVLKEVMRIVS